MNESRLTKISIMIALFSLLMTTAIYAQEMNGKNCCTSNEKKMEKNDYCGTDKPYSDYTIVNNDINKVHTAVTTATIKLEAWNEVCPVKGNKVDPEADLVAYNDKVYGFCCNGCNSSFIKDPQKFSGNLSNDGKSFIGEK